MKLNIFIVVLLSSFISTCFCLSIDSRMGKSLENKEPIDPARKYFLGWTVDESRAEIVFEVEVAANGYVGFGISPNGAMSGADIFIAGVKSDGTVYSGDYHATRNGMPILDKHNDWKLIEAVDNTTHTKLRFSRLLETCDSEDFPITGDTSRVIWSIGSTDELAYHVERGSISVNFLIPDQPFNPEEYQHFDTMIDMQMPAQHTTYWCSLHKGQKFDKKHHVVAFEANLPTLESVRYTHHFVMYQCEAPVGEDPDEYFERFLEGPGGNCYADGDNRLPFFANCQHPMYIWATGGKRLVFPDDVGYSIGEVANASQYYMLEIHYDNPAELEGVSFPTGVRTYYTPNLRQIEAAPMVMGHVVNPSTLIPPDTSDFLVVGHCSSDCTQKHFPTEGITIFNSLLHAHLSGRKLKIRHFRNGTELPWVDNDANYDFQHQQNKPLRNFVQVLPGDHLTYECTYDSTWNENHEAVTGGFSTRDEMCETFIWYYPKIDLLQCMSTYPTHQGYLDLGITKYKEVIENGLPSVLIEEPESMRGSYIDSVSFKFNWTSEFLQEFQEKRRFGEHDVKCKRLVGKVKYPEIEQEYVPIDTCNGRQGSLDLFLSDAMQKFPSWLQENKLDPTPRSTEKHQHEAKMGLMYVLAEMATPTLSGFSTSSSIKSSASDIVDGNIFVEVAYSYEAVADYTLTGNVSLCDRIPIEGRGQLEVTSQLRLSMNFTNCKDTNHGDGFLNIKSCQRDHTHFYPPYAAFNVQGLSAGGYEEKAKSYLEHVYRSIEPTFLTDYVETYLEHVFSTTSICQISAYPGRSSNKKCEKNI